ncbi:MAG TPA: class I SAM-dependent methyltransferase [Bryobacteraceae bacterium]|nr:class I SAM-dependent methyltransferase [Bryobacteraceae bacterium]
MISAQVFRFWKGSEGRISRFHNEKGYFALGSFEDIRDCGISLASTSARILFQYRPRRPWISMKAFRFLRRHLPPDATVFEWSSGTSTLWFEDRCREVHAVEDNREWFEFVRKQVKRADVQFKTGEQYVSAIHAFPDNHFDVISIDGSHRLACFEAAHRHLKPGGILLIDNTDKDQKERGEIWRMDQEIERASNYQVHRFPGWLHGNWAPIETTICIHRGAK